MKPLREKAAISIQRRGYDRSGCQLQDLIGSHRQQHPLVASKQMNRSVTKKWLVHCARWLRERAKVNAWRDRSEKLAKQCAMAMANGREEPGRFVGPDGSWKSMEVGSTIFCSSKFFFGLNSRTPNQHQAPSWLQQTFRAISIHFLQTCTKNLLNEM